MSLPETPAVLEHEWKDTLISVNDVNLSFDDNHVLRDLNITIRDVVRPGRVQGQVIGFLGPSGMGKTQAFRIIAGLNQPDSGEVLVGPEQVPTNVGMIGIVSQHYPLFMHRTVLGNLMVAGRLAGLTDATAKAKAFEQLDKLNLDRRIVSKYPIVLSGGQRQRVAIAQQFMCSDRFLFMDEPFSGLDPIALERVAKIIEEVANLDELNTVVVITHDIASAVEVSDTLLLLGRDRDEQGEPVMGARIQRTYDLIEKGLAWRRGIKHTHEFHEVMAEIDADFHLM